MFDFLYDNKTLRGILCASGAVFAFIIAVSNIINISRLQLDSVFGEEVFGGGFNIYTFPVESESCDSGGDVTLGEESEDSVEEALLAFAELDLSASSPLDIIDYTGRADIPTADFSGTPSGLSGNPSVLIIHTHGSEKYKNVGQNSYSPNESFRSDSAEGGVVAAGRALADALIGYGIGVIHCETMFDLDSYADAYKASAAAVSAYLKIYPTIEYVIDLHRDSVEADGIQAAVRGYADGRAAAQLMFVVGSDSAGADHTDWRVNFSLACGLQKLIYGKYPSVVRQISIRRESFNQQLSHGYLLVEIGACGNDIDEACCTAEILAWAIAEYTGQT